MEQSPQQLVAASVAAEEDLEDWCLIDPINSNCILPSVLVSDAATAGWGSSFMQRAKTRLFMSLSRAPKELPASAYGPAPIWLLGAQCNDADDFRQRCASLLWFSYRQGFPPIEPSTLTTDVGWGCVLRAGQMLLGNSLMRLLAAQGRAAVDSERRVLPWFADQPGAAHPYSVHNIAQLGTLFGIKIGEWFQPSIIAKVLKLLVRKYSPFGATFYYSHDRVIYRHNVALLCTATEPHDVQSPRSSARAPPADAPWRPIIVMATVRLGVGDAMNPMYIPSFMELLRVPQCVGIIGGKPNASLYFVGMQNETVFYLDPHFVQPAVSADPGGGGGVTDDALGAGHHASVLSMSFYDLDPCFAVGFLCTTRDEFDAMCDHLADIEARDPSSCIIGVGEQDPDYGQRETRATASDPLSHLVFTKRPL